MKTIEICIPALNEAAVIENTLRELLKATTETGDHLWNFLVVDNGSTDATADIVSAMQHSQIKVVTITQKGKGRAVIHAAKHSTADYFGYVDADLSANPKYLKVLLEEVENGVSLAVGSRFHSHSSVNRSMWRSLTSLLFNSYSQLMVPVPVKDSQCGMKIMDQKSRELLAMCTETGWWFDREFIARVYRKGLLIKELPIEWEEFFYPDRKSRLSLFKDGLNSLKRMYQIRKKLKKSD